MTGRFGSVAMTTPRSSSEAEAYQRLHGEIAAGTLSPNERLVEQDLIDRFGLSRPAIRTALIRLEHDGLVVREPNRGARVRLVSEDEAAEILEARAALESVAARLAAVRAGPEEVAELERLAAEMSALHDRGDLIAMSESNARLHSRIVQISGHGTIERLTRLLTPQLVRFQWRTILQPGRPQHSLAEHREIVDAIAAHDGEAAERAMRRHLGNVAQVLRDRGDSDVAA